MIAPGKAILDKIQKKNHDHMTFLQGKEFILKKGALSQN